MKIFEVIRHVDETGVSGTGKVLQGVVFKDGTTVIRWCVENNPNSTAIYKSFEEFKFLHVDSHPDNSTEFIFYESKESKRIFNKDLAKK